MRNQKWMALAVLCLASEACAANGWWGEKKAQPASPVAEYRPEGWSIDIGGQYTWMALTTPPTYSGSTGGAQGRITYQKPKAFYGQLRSIYNAGGLSHSSASSSDSEWYSEFTGGYSFSINSRWSMTPYVGVGMDFFTDNKKAYSTYAAIELNYKIYYALAGVETHYLWNRWSLGLQVDCLPTFNQYLSIGGLPGNSWKMTKRVGFDARLPIAYRLVKNIWLEVAPYYRWLPIGASSVLTLPHRNLMQWGAFVMFRFFI